MADAQDSCANLLFSNVFNMKRIKYQIHDYWSIQFWHCGRMDTAALFCERLKKLVVDRYGSLDRFYLDTGFSKGHLSNLLRGKNSPSLEVLIRLAGLLEIEVKDFFVFPEDNERHALIALLDQYAEETIQALLPLLGPQTTEGTSSSAGTSPQEIASNIGRLRESSPSLLTPVRKKKRTPTLLRKDIEGLLTEMKEVELLRVVRVLEALAE